MTEATMPSGRGLRRAIYLWMACGLLVSAGCGYVWAISDVSLSPTPVLRVAFLGWALVALIGLFVGAVVFVVGRRRAEDEADRTGQPIRKAIDAFDKRMARSVVPLMLVVMAIQSIICGLSAMETLVQQAQWLKVVLAGLFPAIFLVLTGWNLVLTVRRARA